MVNFDTAANVKKNPHVLNAYNEAVHDSYNSHSKHSLGYKSAQLVENTTTFIKSLFPAYEKVDYVSGGGTMANKRAILDSIPFNPKTIRKDVKKNIVLISSMEHASIHNTVSKELSQRGYIVVQIPSTIDGFIHMEKYIELLQQYHEHISLISIHSVNNEIGTIQNISSLVKFARDTNPNIIFHSDSVQGIYYINQWEYSPDSVTLSMYKIGGVHFGLVLHNNNLNVNYSGTLDVPSIVSCGTALKIYMENMEKCFAMCSNIKQSIKANIHSMCDKIGIGIKDLSGNNTVPYIQSILFPTGYQGSIIVKMLDERGIFTSSGSACSSEKGSNGSHVIQSMMYSKDASTGSIRLSFSDDITEDDCQVMYTELESVLSYIKSIVTNIAPPEPHSTPVQNLISVPNSNTKHIMRTNTPLDLDLATVNTTQNAILIVYGELALKKGNRQRFTEQLVSNIMQKLDRSIDKMIRGRNSSFITTTPDRISSLVKILSKTPGVVKVSPGILNNISTKPNAVHTINAITSSLITEFNPGSTNVIKFKVMSNVRDEKTWNDYGASKWNYMFGQYIVDRFSDGVMVNLKDFDISVHIDMMEKYTFVYVNSHKGTQGLPVGSEGKLLCMIFPQNYYRSIAASIQMIGRGARVDFVVNDLDENNTNALKAIISEYTMCTIYTEIPSLYKYQCVIVEPNDLSTSVDSYEFHENLRNFSQHHNKISISVTEASSPSDINCILNKVDDPIPFSLQTKKEKVLILLSGGIDSPVAAYKLLERGYEVSFVHYSTDFDKINNILSMIRIMKEKFPTLTKTLHVVKFKELQDKIKDVCVESYRTLMYKIYMLRFASNLANSLGINILATGNAWGQVASQTPENIVICRSLTDKYIISPLIGYNKDDIMRYAQMIGTFAPSTCDGTDDCCVMYLPKHPVLKGEINKAKEFMGKIDDNSEVFSLPMQICSE